MANFEYYSIEPLASVIIVGAGPTNYAIPTLDSGNLPQYLSIRMSGTEAGDGYMSVTPRIGTANGAIATGLVLTTRDAEVVLNVSGYDHIGVDKIGIGTVYLSLTPLTDG